MDKRTAYLILCLISDLISGFHWQRGSDIEGEDHMDVEGILESARERMF